MSELRLSMKQHVFFFKKEKKPIITDNICRHDTYFFASIFQSDSKLKN